MFPIQQAKSPGPCEKDDLDSCGPETLQGPGPNPAGGGGVGVLVSVLQI